MGESLTVRLSHVTPVSLDVQFSCGAGDVLAIFGPSGSGKTTILRAIAGLTTPDVARVEVSGQVWTDTATATRLPAHDRPVGFVFQDYALFPHLSARGNVEIALGHLQKSGRRANAERLLRSVHLPTQVDDRAIRTLSGGERQRVALARALAREPRVLLLDEPFAAVDRTVRLRLQDEVDSIRRTLAIPTVLVTHDLSDVFRLATHVLILDRGRTVVCDTLAAVTSRPDAGALRGLIGSGSVVDAIVVRVSAERGLAWLDIGGAELVVPSTRAELQTRLRVRVPAREVILATERPAGLSLHNALPATVTAVEADGDGPYCIVQLSVGRATLLAEVTRDAVRTLGVAPGRALFALVKSVSVELLGGESPA